MAIFDNDKILIKYEELPKFNGVAISSIYKKYYDTSGVKRVSPPEEEREYYYLLRPYFFSLEGYYDMRVKKLPHVFEQLFEQYHQISEDGSMKLDNFWYRTSCSGNGSFIDQSIYCNGPTRGHRDPYHSLTRNSKNPDISKKNQYELAKKLFATLNTRFQVRELGEHEYTYEPAVTLRNIDGLNYPDTIEAGWRRDYHMPYVSNDKKYDDDWPFGRRVINGLRVYHPSKMHVYLQKISLDDLDKDGVEEYVHVTFDSRVTIIIYFRCYKKIIFVTLKRGRIPKKIHLVQ